MKNKQIAVELTKAFFRSRGGIYTPEKMVRAYSEILSILQGLYDEKIIEEDNNKIEKLEYTKIILTDCNGNEITTDDVDITKKELADKINEIIDRLNNME